MYNRTNRQAAIKNIIKLQLQSPEFNIFKAMPLFFTINTKNNFSVFNTVILAKVSTVISNHLKENPSSLEYNLDIEDRYNVLSKFEQLLQGKLIKFVEREMKTVQLISNKLNLIDFPDFSPENRYLFKTSKYKNSNKNSNSMSNFYINDSNIILNQVLIKKYMVSYTSQLFTIQTDKSEYMCNIFGVLSSTVIREHQLKDPAFNFYKYEYEDTNEEFQFICDFFNLKDVKLTNQNAYAIKEIAENLGIQCILSKVDEFINDFEKVSNSIDDQQITIESVDDVFDNLYHIKEKTVDSVANFILDSIWSKTDENVFEFGSFILQVAQTDIKLHQYLIDLLIKLDKEKNESNSLKTLIPSIVERSFFLFSKKAKFKDNSLIFPFVYKMYKDKIISKDQLYNEINSIINISSNKFFHSWFLPEIVEIDSSMSNIRFKKGIIEPKSDYTSNSYKMRGQYRDAKLFYSCDSKKIEEYKEIRDKGEVDNLITKALREDDIDTFQSFISKNTEKMLKITIQPNMFENFIGNNMRYLNYAAVYGSIKCFKYMKLNNEKIDNTTFEMSIIGGNNEIIRIVFNEKVEFKENSKKNYFEYKETSILNALYQSIRYHKNDLFDWILEQNLDIINKIDKLIDLSICSINNSNIHSLVQLIVNGFEFHECSSSYPLFMKLTVEKGFYSYASFIINLINFELNSAVAVEILINCIPIKSKEILNKIIEKINELCPLDIKLFSIAMDKTKDLRNIEAYKKISDIIYKHNPNNDFTNIYLNAVVFNLKELIEYFLEKKYLKNDAHLSTKISSMGSINSEIFILLYNSIEDIYKTKMLQCINDAIKIKNKPLIKYLLSENAPLHNTLFTAVDTNDLEIVEIILEKNSDPSFINEISANGTVLINAIRKNNITIVQKLLSIPGINLNIYHEKFMTPLILSANQLKYEIFCSIIEFYGEDIKNQKLQLENSILTIIEGFPNGMTDCYSNSKNYSFEQYDSYKFNYINRVDSMIKFFLKIIQLNCIDINMHIQVSTSNQKTLYYTPLLYACKINSLDIVKSIIKQDQADLNIYFPDSGDTPLITSIRNKNYEISKLLIEHPKTNINAKNYQNETALLAALSLQQNKIIDLLLKDEKFDPDLSNINLAFFTSNLKQFLSFKSLDVNYVPPNSLQFVKIENKNVVKTSLIKSIINNDYELFDLIIQHPSFLKNKQQLIDTAHFAILSHNLKVADYLFNLLKEFNFDINSPVFNNNNLLIEAIKLNLNDNIITYILNLPNFDSKKSDIDKAFTLCYSNLSNSPKKVHQKGISFQMTNILDILYNYDVNHDHLIDLKKEKNGNSHLSNIYKILFSSQGFDPNKALFENNFLLEYTIKNNFYVLSLCLINSDKIDPVYYSSKNIKNSKHITYLHLACEMGNSKLVEEILSKKMIDINATDKDGETPLMIACKCQQVECIKFLFKFDGLDFSHKNNTGHDAISMLRNTIKKSSFFLSQQIKKFAVDDKKEINDKDEYLAKLLELIDCIKNMYKMKKEMKTRNLTTDKQINSNEVEGLSYFTDRKRSLTPKQDETTEKKITKFRKNLLTAKIHETSKETGLTETKISNSEEDSLFSSTENNSTESRPTEKIETRISSCEENSLIQSTEKNFTESKETGLTEKISNSEEDSLFSSTENNSTESRPAEKIETKISSCKKNSLIQSTEKNSTESKQAENTESNLAVEVKSSIITSNDSCNEKTQEFTINSKQQVEKEISSEIKQSNTDTSFDQSKFKIKAEISPFFTFNIIDKISPKTKFETYNESFSEEPDIQEQPKIFTKRENLFMNHHKIDKIHSNEFFDDSTNRKSRKLSHSKSSRRKRHSNRIDKYSFYDDEDNGYQNYEQIQNQTLILQQQQQQWLQMIQINNQFQAQLDMQMMNQSQINQKMQKKTKKKK